MLNFYEFFAGGGMARAGLGADWNCLFANDIDTKKGFSYQANWGTGGELKICDIIRIGLSDLHGNANLAWASFPCQDLSLAGGGAGLEGTRSGTFYSFWHIIKKLSTDGRAPNVIVLENVCGALTSHNGKDFQSICQTFLEHDYDFGALIIDAADFVPQSRKRLFLIGVQKSASIPVSLTSDCPVEPFHSRALRNAVNLLPEALRQKFLWWNLPTPPRSKMTFSEIIEETPADVSWHEKSETDKLLRMMSDVNLAKVNAAQRAGRRMVGSLYRRTRRNENDQRVQRAEVRFDDVAGCLRTPGGGSSRQTIIVVDGRHVRTRLISSRETARLMGLDDDYKLPKNYNEAYHLTGDGVVVPVVRHLAHHLLEPLLGFKSNLFQAVA